MEGINYYPQKEHSRLCRIATGIYTGTGLATQVITGVGFRPKVVMVLHQLTGEDGFFYKTDQDGLNSWHPRNGFTYQYIADMIISMDDDGFTVGDSQNINVLDHTYSYSCWG